MTLTKCEFSRERLIKETKRFHTKKRLGQNFLVEPSALEAIAAALDTDSATAILEIGPGLGFLTRLLCRQSNCVMAIDLDREVIEELARQALPNVYLCHGDVLSLDLDSWQLTKNQGYSGFLTPPVEFATKISVVGNVPYQITGLILGHLLGELDKPASWLKKIEQIVLTVQAEVAERMTARPGTTNYSQLSVLTKLYCQAEVLHFLPSDNFCPAPKVNSAVVRLTPHQSPLPVARNPRLFRQIVKAGFKQRRKMLRKALLSLSFSEAKINTAFAELNFDPQGRAQDFSIQQFIRLADQLGG